MDERVIEGSWIDHDDPVDDDCFTCTRCHVKHPRPAVVLFDIRQDARGQENVAILAEWCVPCATLAMARARRSPA